MKKRLITLATLATLAALFVLPAHASSSEGSFTRSLKVASGEVLLSVTTGSGNITVRTGSGDAIEVRGRIRAHSGWGMDADEKVKRLEAQPPVEQDGNSIRIGHIEDRDLRQNVSIDYELTVPARTRVTSETGSGDQHLDGLQGALRAHTGSGNVVLANITADTRAESGSGDLELSNVRGHMYVDTGSGNIRTSRVAGAFVGNSGSGDIHLDQTASGEVKVETGSGNVVATGVDGSLSASTGSGDIEIQGQQRGDWQLSAGSGNVRLRLSGDKSFEVDLHTSSGSIDVDFPVTVQGSFRKNELRGKVGAGAYLMRVHTGSGDIEIH
jgi:hypothetical protein